MEDYSAGILLIYVISVYILYEFQFVCFILSCTLFYDCLSLCLPYAPCAKEPRD